MKPDLEGEERITDWEKTDWPDPEIYGMPSKPYRRHPWKLIAPAFLIGVGLTLVILKLVGAL